MALAPVELDRAAVCELLSGNGKQLVDGLRLVAQRGEAGAAYYGYTADVAQLLKHEDAEVAAAACEAMGSFGPSGEDYAASVAGLLTAEEPELRTAAANALAMFGPAAYPYADSLVTLMGDSDETAKCSAVGALGQIGAESQAKAIAELLKDKSPVVVAAACQALGELASAGEAQAADVAKQLDDAQVRYPAICALSNLGEGVLEKYKDEIISKCLTDKDSLTRTTAAEAIGKIAVVVSKSSSSLAKVTELLKHEHAGVRCAAALAMGHMGDTVAEHAAALVPLLEDKAEDPTELYLTVGGGSMRVPPSARLPKCAALTALGMMGAGSQAEACADCLSDESWEVKLCALECLALLGDDGRKESSKIAACLEDDIYAVRAKACECLGALRAEDGLHNVPDLFEDKAPSVRAAALVALAEMQDVAQGYSNEVFKLVGDQIPSVQAAAIFCLGCMGEIGQSYASIIGTKLFDEDAGVRAAACEALGKLGAYGAAFAEEVAYNLEDASPEVRMKAVRALGKMGSEGEAFFRGMQQLMGDPYGEVSSAAKEAILALENKDPDE